MPIIAIAVRFSTALAEVLLNSLRLPPDALVLLAPVRDVGVDINPSFLMQGRRGWQRILLIAVYTLIDGRLE